MSIAPPSDIILDVARAADPQRLQAATAKLGAMAAGTGGASGTGPADFGALLAAAAPKPPAAAAVGSSPGTSTLFQGHAATASNGLSPYQKFEAVLLQTFVQEMLPKDDKLFGDAASADAYRGMMAEQLAEQLARSGRIGIARMIERAHGPAAAGPSAPAHAAPAAATAAPIHAPVSAAAGADPSAPDPSAPAPSAPAPSAPDEVA